MVIGRGEVVVEQHHVRGLPAALVVARAMPTPISARSSTCFL
jgi:hypothetical protein